MLLNGTKKKLAAMHQRIFNLMYSQKLEMRKEGIMTIKMKKMVGNALTSTDHLDKTKKGKTNAFYNSCLSGKSKTALLTFLEVSEYGYEYG